MGNGHLMIDDKFYIQILEVLYLLCQNKFSNMYFIEF